MKGTFFVFIFTQYTIGIYGYTTKTPWRTFWRISTGSTTTALWRTSTGSTTTALWRTSTGSTTTATKAWKQTYPTTSSTTKAYTRATAPRTWRNTASSRTPFHTSIATSSRSHCQYLTTMPHFTTMFSTKAYTKLRLVNGPTIYSGRVEVYHSGIWGTICDDAFDDNDARVVCRMLGMNYGYAKAFTNAHFGQGRRCIALDDLQCYGTEYDITRCSSGGWFNHNCGHSEDAGVDCNPYYKTSSETPTETRKTLSTRPTIWKLHASSPTTSTTYATTNYTTRRKISQTSWQISLSRKPSTYAFTPIRLVNGRTRNSGRVEVYHNGQWGTICDEYFDRFDARVICRMLGLYRGDSYSKAYTGAHFGEGQGIIWLGSLGCTGYEYDLTNCRFYGWGGYSYCGHKRDAGVDCNAHPYGDVTLPWYFWYTTDSDPTTEASMTTQEGPRLEDSVAVNCNENGWDIRVDMHTLRQVYPGSKASDIYLGENTCNGIESWNTVTFHQGLRECLTSETIRKDSLVYSNELVYAQHDPVHPFIIRYYNWTVGVECDVQRNETSDGHLHHDHINSNTNQVSGTSHYSVNMTFFKDPGFSYQIHGNPLHVTVGSSVFVKVFTHTSDWTIKMRVHTCYTKPTPSASDNMRYYILKNGCEVDKNTHIISQSSHETRFVFQDFEYTTNHEGIYVHCDAMFCGSSDYTNQCLQTCHPVVKRRAM